MTFANRTPMKRKREKPRRKRPELFFAPEPVVVEVPQRMPARTRLNPRRAEPRRSERVRDPAFLSWVHTQPCSARDVPGHRCAGPIEADHMGERPAGRKADDITCAAMCQLGHRERTDFSGPFRSFDQAQMRAFLAESMRVTRLAYARHLLSTSAHAA